MVQREVLTEDPDRRQPVTVESRFGWHCLMGWVDPCKAEAGRCDLGREDHRRPQVLRGSFALSSGCRWDGPVDSVAVRP
jgi:hypothetical protein